jgi:hypothetical protein
LKNKEIHMRELERQHDDKLNIIRSMAASNNNTPNNDYSRKRCQSEERVLQEIIPIQSPSSRQGPAVPPK